MKASTLLELGRVSNLPTVWSNVVCGAVLSGAALAPTPIISAGVAGTLFYVGGMFLNDAFDAEIDARERPTRPIPSGRATRREVFVIGSAMLAVGLLLLAIVTNLGALAAGVVTAAAVVVYDRWHKAYAWSPIVMGICRAGLYGIAALAVSGQLSTDVIVFALLLLLYILGLTHVARFETGSVVARAWPSLFVLAPLLVSAVSLIKAPLLIPIWVATLLWTVRSLAIALRGGKGAIPRAVVSLIAGVSLVDATFMASRGALGLAIFGVVAFALTLLLQRVVRGT